jgi:MFS family permease
LTGAGIGGEASAIGSAILEFTPARFRGRVHLFVAGNFWLGAILGALVTMALLSTELLPPDNRWRLTFGIGSFLALIVVYMRRFVPESRRWLLAHGRHVEAGEIVTGIEASANARYPRTVIAQSV